MRFSTLFLVGYVALEVLGFMLVVSDFGFMVLALEIILSAIGGFWILLRTNQGLFNIFNNVFEEALQSHNIFKTLIFSYMYYIGAICLILPGVFGDIFGIILLGCSFIIKSQPQQFSSDRHHNRSNEEDIIDVEIIEVREEGK